MSFVSVKSYNVDKDMNQKQKRTLAQRYVDLLTNSGFKALFGDESNKDVVMMIINEFLPPHRKVTEIFYMPTEHQGPVIDSSKECHYDFMCHTPDGTKFIVEMQRYYERHWFKRCVTYASRAYDKQNKRGEDYDVPPVYLIGLMGVRIDHPDVDFWKNRYISEYTFREISCGDLLAETIFIIFAELADFNKQVEECETSQDRMLYILKNVGRLKDRPAWLQDEIYTRLFEACEISQFTEDKRIIYEQEMSDEKRILAERQGCYDAGHKEGLEQGRTEMILRMIESGMSVEQIAQITRLAPDEIETLIKRHD